MIHTKEYWLKYDENDSPRITSQHFKLLDKFIEDEVKEWNNGADEENIITSPLPKHINNEIIEFYSSNGSISNSILGAMIAQLY